MKIIYCYLPLVFLLVGCSTVKPNEVKPPKVSYDYSFKKKAMRFIGLAKIEYVSLARRQFICSYFSKTQKELILDEGIYPWHYAGTDHGYFQASSTIKSADSYNCNGDNVLMKPTAEQETANFGAFCSAEDGKIDYSKMTEGKMSNQVRAWWGNEKNFPPAYGKYTLFVVDLTTPIGSELWMQPEWHDLVSSDNVDKLIRIYESYVNEYPALSFEINGPKGTVRSNAVYLDKTDYDRMGFTEDNF
jgi:hypothetical protein